MRRLWLLVFLLLLPARLASASAGHVDRIVTSYMAREHVPGVAVVVLKADRVVLAKGWGQADVAAGRPMTATTEQPIYSISKHMTAALALSLADEGRLRWTDPVGKFLPEILGDEPQLTLSQLMSHTSGLANFQGLPGIEEIEKGQSPATGLEDVLALVDHAPRRFAPGAWHAYSNSNYTALALIAERTAGADFEALARNRLFAPLGFTGIESCNVSRARGDKWSTGYTPAGKPWTLPANLRTTYVGNGGMCADALSLARWVRSLFVGRVVSRASLAAMTRPTQFGCGLTAPYGFGVSTKPVAGRRAFSHAAGGEGWGGWFAYLPDDALTIVVLANRGWVWSTDMGQPIARAILGSSQPPALRRLPLSRAERAALHGRSFDDGLFKYAVSADPKRVVVRVDAFDDPIELWKQAPGVFLSPQRPDTFSLTRARNGQLIFDWMEHRAFLRAPLHSSSPQAPVSAILHPPCASN
jgi:CubicO group peptidase (beta-lactamase class C family)